MSKDVGNNNKPAFLFMLDSGFIVPVHLNGDTAYISKVYYTDDSCKSDPYIVFSSIDPYVFPSILTQYKKSSIIFVPKDGVEENIKARSAYHLHDNYSNCLQVSKSINAFRAIENLPEKTQWAGFSSYPIAELRDLSKDKLYYKDVLKKNIDNDMQYDEKDFEKEFFEEDLIENGICPSLCNDDFKNDQVCDEMCNIESCGFDANDCNEDLENTDPNRSFRSILKRSISR